MSVEILRSFDWVVAVLGLAGILILVFTMKPVWRKTSLRWIYLIRLLIIGILLVGLIQPRFSRRITSEKELPWYFYIDNSLSMAYHQNLSLTAMNDGLGELIKKIKADDVQIKVLNFSTEVTPGGDPPITATGTSTDIGLVMNDIQSHKQEGVGGVILLTDGQYTQGLDPVSEAVKLNLPINVIAVGDTSPMVDVAIKSVDVPTVVVKGEDVEAIVTLVGNGQIRDRINVALMQNKTLIGSKFVQLDGNGSQNKITFRFKPTALGVISYRVNASSLAEEINIDNNRQTFDISVLKNEYRIALMTGVPSLNTPLLKRWLEQQPRSQVDHFIESSPNFDQEIKAFWPKSYELIVLDNYPVDPLPVRMQRILAKKIASQGTALFWVAGPNVTGASAASIYPLLHVQSVPVPDTLSTGPTGTPAVQPAMENLPVAFSDEFSPAKLTNFPPVRWGVSVESQIPTSWNLMSFTESNLPLLLISEKEGLRSAVWTTPDFNKLHYNMIQTRTPQFIPNLFNGVLAWLMRTGGDQDLYFRLNKNSYQQGEQILAAGNKIGQETSPFSEVSIAIMRDSTLINTYEFQYNTVKNRWEGQFWASTPGNYTYTIHMKSGVSISRQTGKFQVEQSQIELNNVFLNQALLRNIAGSTKGRMVPWDQRKQIQDIVTKVTRTDSRIVRYIPTESFWSLILIILLLTFEWGIRRFHGLL